jgi:cytochrome d ubiquinol oxidase subunit I
LWQLRRAGWEPSRLPRAWLQALRFMSFSGWVATLAGWYVTEIGRQPFIVFGELRTAEVVTSTPPAHIALTFSVYLVMYVLLIAAYIAVLRYMSEKPLASPAQTQTGRAIAQAGHDANLPQGAQP